MQHQVKYSVLDLSPITVGGTPADSFRSTLDLAQHAERWGYTRFWLAEHHNIPGIASAATAVVIGHVAGGTSRMRIGAGGIMLPNHAPLVIAEQFGTLASMYPGRIDLGLGRAPGGDHATARALRRNLRAGGDSFPQDLQELRSYFHPADGELISFGKAGNYQAVRAIPGEGLDVPVYLLGSSDFSAALAADEGLPFAFASHFAPTYIHAALALYRSGFKPSDAPDGIQSSYAMVGVNVIAADSDDEARRLFTSVQQAFLGMIRGNRGNLPPPVQTMDGRWSPAEQAQVGKMLQYSVVGGPTALQAGLEKVLADTRADELILTAQLFDHQARLKSFEIAADVLHRMSRAPAGAGAT